MMIGLLMRTLALAFTCTGLAVLSTRSRRLLVVLGATAIVKVADLSAVEQRLVEHRIDLIVNKASPAGGSISGRDLWRILLEMLLEVRSAFAAEPDSQYCIQSLDSQGLYTMDKVARTSR